MELNYDDFLEARRVDAFERCPDCGKREDRCKCVGMEPEDLPESER